MWIDKIIERINGVLQVNESKYIMMHAPKNAINEITTLLPGTESPTVIPLDGINDTVAVHVVCKDGLLGDIGRAERSRSIIYLSGAS